MTRRRFLAPTLLLLVTGVVFVGCDNRPSGSGTNRDPGTGDIIIGHVAALTGDTATFGVSSN